MDGSRIRCNSGLAEGLSRSEVHVWAVELIATSKRLRELDAILSVDEHRRADAFRFENLRTRFTICRGTLRTLIGSYVAVHPQEIRFSYAPSGKPSLIGHDGLSFNVSHSGDIALFGFTTGCPLGVD